MSKYNIEKSAIRIGVNADGPITIKEQGEITSELGRLSLTIDRVLVIGERLASKLSPVLSQDVPGVDTAKNPNTKSCAIAQQIEDETGRLEVALTIFNSIEDRIAI